MSPTSTASGSRALRATRPIASRTGPTALMAAASTTIGATRSGCLAHVDALERALRGPLPFGTADPLCDNSCHLSTFLTLSGYREISEIISADHGTCNLGSPKGLG